ncbi:hypothetical protein [Salinisphaera sp. Q1T1-3]|uniref:hypothetical protein n=1 Tax=Salinisphaera sp. Q1T1-3 TaxID=2321229 RepID=UPI000E751775|nr:hypothetical protein [Salinisphaera sp. Q1T1-3]RJS94685.1 hypothetical protein D3260_02610 [Salinisphaera sp. Q1T1-3]
MQHWQVRQLTRGTGNCVYHAHSYYDIPVFDPSSRFVATHRMGFADRPIEAEDTVEIGVVEVATGHWQSIGRSSAWSWQQGPMAQWLGGSATQLCWNDRDDDDRFVTRLWDMADGRRRTLARSSYAVDPHGGFTLGINMARLDTLRPGYGYAGGRGARLDAPAPDDDGVWCQSIATGESRLVLSIARARAHLMEQLDGADGFDALRNYFDRASDPIFWFNHVKIAPSGQRFTVKLRFRTRDGGWSDEQGISLTCNLDGTALAVLATAPSHVIWYDDQRLFLWQRDAFYFFHDGVDGGARGQAIAPDVVTQNAHIRYLPGRPDVFVADTPYREEIRLFVHDESSGRTRDLATFAHHRPARSPFRCDLHPCPSPDGRHIAVTSLQDGGRQLYVLSCAEPASS